MPDLQELEAIKRLKYRYCRTLDLKCWDELAACLTDDASPHELVRRLEREGHATRAKVTIPEGWNRFDIAKRLESLHVSWGTGFLDATANTVTLGPRTALERPGLVADAPNWLMASPPAPGTRAWVRIRYNHTGAMATLEPQADGTLVVRFDEPQLAVTPGQLAVMYAGERCLGGAVIRAALPVTTAPAAYSAA